MSKLNDELCERALWISKNSEWSYSEAIDVLNSCLIKEMYGSTFSIYAWLNAYYKDDFKEKIPFSRSDYKNIEKTK